MAESKVGDSTVDSHVANAIEELAASGCELIANWTNEGARQSEWSDSLFLNHSSDLRSRTSHGDPQASGRESIGWPPKEAAGNGQEPNRIGCGATANGQGSMRKYATVVADRAFRV